MTNVKVIPGLSGSRFQVEEHQLFHIKVEKKPISLADFTALLLQPPGGLE